MVRAYITMAAVAALLLIPAAASASTVHVSGCHAFNGGSCIEQEFRYTADPGEVNDVEIVTQSSGTFSSTYDIKDPGAVIFLPPDMLEDPPGAQDPTCHRESDHHVECDALGNVASAAFTTIRLGDMNDQVRVTPSVDTDIFGGPGDDLLSASGRVDRLHGEDGNDTLITTDDAADDLFGEAGDDLMRTSQPLSRTDPDGGPGLDTFDFSNRNGNVTATANAEETDTVNGYPNIENFIGGDGGDTLTGDEGPNELTGGRGRDTLSGLGGDDFLDPAGGFLGIPPIVDSDRDVATGGAGIDHVTYAARSSAVVVDMDGVADDGQSGEGDNIGADVENLTGGSGGDTLIGNALANLLHGGAGNATDAIDGEGGIDTVSYQGRGADLSITLDGAANDGALDGDADPTNNENDDLAGDIENAWGGHGDDRMVGSNGRAVIPGGPFIGGANELRGGAGDDTISALGGNDVLLGDGFPLAFLGSDDDLLSGGPGNDRLQGDTAAFGFFIRGSDTMQGGTGTDLADYSDRSANLILTLPEPGVVLPPADDGEAGEGDRLHGDVENLDAGAGSDIVTGNEGPNVLNGGPAGNDSLNGAGGADALNGGNEAFAAGAGDNLIGAAGADALGGGSGNDTLDGGLDADVLSGGDGNDTLHGGDAGDSLAGDAGTDVQNGGAGDDSLASGTGAGTLNGDAGADTLTAVGSNSLQLNGGDDSDSLDSTGALGLPVLDGGAGSDTLRTGTTARETVGGGADVDHVTYAARPAAVTVTIGDGLANDGTPGPGGFDDNVLADVENVTGTSLGDSLTGSPDANVLDGAAGPDTLTGGEGPDVLQGGSEDDWLKSRDASADTDDCGAGEADKVTKDALDSATNCELVAPENTVAPALSGTPTDGQTLTVSDGTWTGTPPIGFAYQWRRCDTTGGACVDIAGATGSNYVLTPADVGQTLRGRVTASNGVDSTVADSAASATIAPAPPANTALPSITGMPRDRETLTAVDGSWTGTPNITFAYQWRRCNAGGGSCANVPGATAKTLALTPADVGRTLRVIVTADNAAPGTVAATSGPTAVVAPAPPVNTSKPTLSGEARVGQTLNATQGVWTGTPVIAFAYQWRSCNADVPTSCVNIAGATGSSYTAKQADIARRLRVRVTGTNAGGSASADSDPSFVVVPANAPPTPDVDPPAVALSMASQSPGQVAQKGFVFEAQLDEAGELTALLTMARRVARGLGIASARPVVVGRKRRSVAEAGKVRVRIKLKRKARRRLKDVSRVRLTLRLRVVDEAGNASRRKRRVVLKAG